MPRVLFWNVQRKQLDALVLPLIADHALDVVVLVESPSRSRLATLLAPSGWQRVSRTDRFTVFSKQTVQFLGQPGTEPTDRVEFWQVTPAGELTGSSRPSTVRTGETRPRTRDTSCSGRCGR